MKHRNKIGAIPALKLCIALIGFVALMWTMGAPDAEAYMDFSGCAGCHSVFGTGPGNAAHDAHAATVSNNCTICHVGGVFNNPPIKTGCAPCHVGAGLRQHHRVKAGQTCAGCHANPENGGTENTTPPGYAETTLNTCNGSEELFPSLTVSLDNDGDGLTDGADPDCALPAEICNDSIDNDSDGFVDCADPDCAADPSCQIGSPEVCNDSIDNDLDGLVDCADPNCAADPICAPPPIWPPAGHTDKEDGHWHMPGKDRPYTNGCTACHGQDLRGSIGPSCYSCHDREWDESAPKEICNDGKDNDLDGKIDCADSDCSRNSACISPPPPGHTDSEDGQWHMPGKDYPYKNGCTACHGLDLRGLIGPSCYSCHGKEWH